MINYTSCYLKPMGINIQNLSLIFIKAHGFILFLLTTKAHEE